jgi:two-component system, NtrC family, sensor kinase
MTEPRTSETAHVHRRVSERSTTLEASLVEAFAEASGTAVVALTRDGSIALHNLHFAKLWDVPEDVLDTGSAARLRGFLEEHGNDAATALAHLFDARDPGDAGEITSSDGRIVAWRSVPYRRDGSEADDGRVWSFRDVTVARQLELALQDAENLLRMFAAHTDGIVLELDAEIRVVGIWAHDSTFFQEADVGLQGRRARSALGPHAGPEFEAHVRRVLETGEPQSFEYALDLRGEHRVFAADAKLLTERPGESARVTVLIRDVTQHARMQTQLLQAERLASVGLLAAGVAHEINNPLAYVLLNLERLQAGLRALDAQRKPAETTSLLDSVEMSLEGCRCVQEIVDKLRRFSRTDRSEPRERIDLSRVLSFALQMAAPTVEPRATIVRELGETPCVLATEGELSQVFLNLIVNAAQAIPEGAPRQHQIRIITATDVRGWAVVEIHDTGPGIPRAILPRVFDPFFTTKALTGGSGLGLAICHGITTSLGGEITVSSQEGSGSVFRVALPPASRGA